VKIGPLYHYKPGGGTPTAYYLLIFFMEDRLLNRLQFVLVDDSDNRSMKGVANCDKSYDARFSVNHQGPD